MGQFHIEPSPICHPHEDPLFLVKKESGVELSYALLVSVVLKL
jgi:hypothetical protein